MILGKNLSGVDTQVYVQQFLDNCGYLNVSLSYPLPDKIAYDYMTCAKERKARNAFEDIWIFQFSLYINTSTY